MNYNISTPSGFPEFNPAQEQVKQQWVRTISEVFELNGFLSVTTPLVEREENLLAKGGNKKEIYVLKRLHDDENDKSHSGNAFRFDHTVPLALYVARHLNNIKFPFRRYSIGAVLRGERSQKGRFRQFDQCDIDIIGHEKLDITNDALIVAIIIQIFEKLNIGDFVVKINNRKVLISFFEDLGVVPENIKSVLEVIDNLEKKGLEKTKDSLVAEGVSDSQIEKIINFMAIKGSPEDVCSVLKTLCSNEKFLEGVNELEEVILRLKEMNVSSDKWALDLSIARGLDYYTGTVYETTLIGNESLGSICSGGRYDDLATLFTGKKLPGVGISIGLTRLLSQLFDKGILDTKKAVPTQVLVVAQDRKYLKECFSFAEILRKKGINTEVYLEPKKTGKQIEYADKLGIPYCAVIGENEVKEGTAFMKNLETGEKESVDRNSWKIL